MSSLYYLNQNDFAKEGTHLTVDLDGISFVLFHSRECKYCHDFIPEFKKLPNAIHGVNFGLCGLDEGNRVISKLSQQSSTPIAAVPKFLLYNNGVPYVEYSGKRNLQAIVTFLQEILGTLNQKQSFTRPRRSRQQMPPQQQQPQQSPQQYPNSPQPQAMAVSPGPSGAPTRPSGMMGGMGGMGGQEQPTNTPYKITPSTGVKEYETSYGRPYNTLNEADFLEYENAYKQMHGGGK